MLVEIEKLEIGKVRKMALLCGNILGWKQKWQHCSNVEGGKIGAKSLKVKANFQLNFIFTLRRILPPW